MKGRIGEVDMAAILKQLRGKKSQSEVANAIGAKQPQYSEWESGKCRPSSKYLPKLCDFFNVTLDQLTGKEPFDKKPYIKKQGIDPVLADVPREKRVEFLQSEACEISPQIIDKLVLKVIESKNKDSAMKIRNEILKFTNSLCRYASRTQKNLTESDDEIDRLIINNETLIKNKDARIAELEAESASKDEKIAKLTSLSSGESDSEGRKGKTA